MYQLVVAGKPLTAKELAERTGGNKGSVSTALGRLHERDYVLRRTRKTDRHGGNPKEYVLMAPDRRKPLESVYFGDDEWVDEELDEVNERLDRIESLLGGESIKR